MRIVGWPEEPDADGCILPVTIVEVDFQGTPEELRAIGEFLLRAAAELDLAESNCLVSCDHIPRRSMALFRAKAMLDELIAGFPPRSPHHYRAVR
jgi:hypothetical protein